MKFILLVFLFMSLANPITGGKLFPGFNNPEKWMKRIIRKLQRKSSAYGQMIASNTAGISNNAGFISSIAACDTNYINNPDYGLSCCFEDTNNLGQCLCNGTTIDDSANPGSCCAANLKHPDHCLCSGTDMDNPNNPGNCCFKDSANPSQCLCNAANFTDDPNKRCFNLDWKGDGVCDDENNHGGCDFDGGDCCGEDVDIDLCTLCQCLEEEAPLPNVVGCCFEDSNNAGQCLCTGTNIDDPANPGSCCMDDVVNPGTCFVCEDSTTCNGNGTCIGNTGICECFSGFTGDRCDIATCPGTPICSGKGTCAEGSVVCDCDDGSFRSDCSIGSLILVAAGYGQDSPYLRTDVTQILDMESNKACTTIANYPLKAIGSSFGLIDNKPLVCGGGTPDGRMPQCYYHNKATDTWTLLLNMEPVRYKPGFIPLRGGLWIVGGFCANCGSNSKTTVFVYMNGTEVEGPELPDRRMTPCLVALNEDEVMLIGSGEEDKATEKTTTIYNNALNTFTAGPTMNYMRRYAACARFKSKLHDNRYVVMSVGGHQISNVELLDYTMPNAQWTETTSVPTDVVQGNELQWSRALSDLTEEGVFLQTRKQELLHFTCDDSTCAWNVINQRIQTPVDSNVFMYLPPGYTECT